MLSFYAGNLAVMSAIMVTYIVLWIILPKRKCALEHSLIAYGINFFQFKNMPKLPWFWKLYRDFYI